MTKNTKTTRRANKPPITPIVKFLIIDWNNLLLYNNKDISSFIFDKETNSRIIMT